MNGVLEQGTMSSLNSLQAGITNVNTTYQPNHIDTAYCPRNCGNLCKISYGSMCTLNR
jgi:hypothetical protein